MKTLFIISKGLKKPSRKEIEELEANDAQPRTLILDDAVEAELLDERYLNGLSKIRRWFYSFLPYHLIQIIETVLIQHRYSLVLSYYEKAGLPIAFLQRLLRLKTPHILLSSWLSSEKKMWFLRRTQNTLSKVIVWSSVQYKYAINQAGIDPAKMKLVKYGVDQKFWRPVESETDMICSVGMEMRDYPTLIEALRTLDIPCHIATGESRGDLFETVKKLYQISDMPGHIKVGAKDFAGLRSLYARSEFVVVPLLQTDTDNGLTAILEAMAMGKTVICTRTEGQVDVIEDGVTGIFVPQGDPDALRSAIIDLWNNPEKCKKMGRAAREYILKNHTMEQFVAAIAEEVRVHRSVTDREKSLNTHNRGFEI